MDIEMGIMGFHEQHGMGPAGFHGDSYADGGRPAPQVYVMVVMTVRNENKMILKRFIVCKNY